MNRVQTSRMAKVMLASLLLAVLLVPGIATADPNEDVEELKEDVEYLVTEWAPRFILEDTPGAVQWLIENPPDPDPTPFVDAFSYPQPEEIPGMLEDIVHSAPGIVESLTRPPTKFYVTVKQEPWEDSDDGSTLLIEYRLYRPGEPSPVWGRSWSGTSSCDGVSGRRTCRAHEDLSGSEVTASRHTKRTSNDTWVEVKASAVLGDEDKQEQAVSSPAVPCAGDVGAVICDAVAAIDD